MTAPVLIQRNGTAISAPAAGTSRALEFESKHARLGASPLQIMR